MGEVWCATDTNLGRQVAIKVLPDAFAQDPDRLARFEREAKTLASLNHPNIAIIHGLEKADGVRALVMSTPVLTGFKAGIGLVIVLDQVPKLLGIHITKEGFIRDLFAVAQHLPATSLITLAVAAATFAILIGMSD